MEQLLAGNKLILMEASIIERLRRSDSKALHPELANSPMIYNDKGRKALSALYQEYIDIASASSLPFLLCTPTWRTNRERVLASGVNPSVNTDAVFFMRELRHKQAGHFVNIKIGGMIGCRNDAYRPDLGLSAAESERFHTWQIERLVLGGVDFLMTATVPYVEEAVGIAKAMEVSGKPYIISFVISRNGTVLDGTALNDAVKRVDSAVRKKPICYMVNCAHPSFLRAAEQPAELYERLMGYQANASALDHSDLDNAKDLKSDSLSEWGDLMIDLNRNYGIRILGGCCGTNAEHLKYIVSNSGL